MLKQTSNSSVESDADCTLSVVSDRRHLARTSSSMSTKPRSGCHSLSYAFLTSIFGRGGKEEEGKGGPRVGSKPHVRNLENEVLGTNANVQYVQRFFIHMMPIALQRSACLTHSYSLVYNANLIKKCGETISY